MSIRDEYVRTVGATERVGLVPEPSAQLLDGLLAARRGRLHHLDTGRVPLRANQPIGRFSWARQSIDLGTVHERAGRVSMFLFETAGNTTPLEVTINGHRLTVAPDQGLQGAHFWRELDLAPGILADGVNLVQLTSENLALQSWALGIAVGPRVHGSAQSWDQGGSWFSEGFGTDLGFLGDFAIRWWVDAAPPTYGVRSPVLRADGRPITRCDVVGPPGVVRTELRTGTLLDGWTEWGTWQSPDQELPAADLVQVRVDVAAGTPTGQLVLTTDAPTRALPGTSTDIVTEDLQGTQLAALRDELDIDALVEGATSDLERAQALCSWIHERWVHQIGTSIYSPWHAPTILAWQRDGAAQGFVSPTGFCVHFAVVLTQLAAAAGLRSRSVILGQMDETGGSGHFVAEVWCRELDGWVCFDPDFDYHWQRDGRPCGVVGVHEAWRAGRLGDLTLAKGRAFTRNPHGGGWPLEHLEGGGYAWFGLPVRQDWLRDPRSRLMHHGAVNYHETDVLWFDGQDGLRQRYPLVSDRLDDFEGTGSP